MELLSSLEKKDFNWSDSGDFVIQNGDIKDTRLNTGEGFLEEVARRIQSSAGDWKLEPVFGASLIKFEGENNDEDLWEAIESAIKHSLTLDMFLYPKSFTVNVAPIDVDEVAIRVDFNTELDIILGTELPAFKMVYNLTTHQPYIMR